MNNPFEEILCELKEIKNSLANIPQATAPIPAEIIDTRQLCERLGISEPTAIKWRNKKKIPSFKVGSSIRFNWPSVVMFLESNSKTK